MPEWWTESRDVLLAEGDRMQRFRQMGGNFRGEEAALRLSDFVLPAVILAALVALIWLMARMSSRRERQRVINSPKALFRGLCHAHRLDGAACRLLKRLARRHGLAQPALLFVEPERYNVQALGPEWARDGARLAALRARVFAERDDTQDIGAADGQNRSAAMAGAGA